MNIPISTYTGYLWYSDKSEPEVYVDQDLTVDLTPTENPFIIEGFLKDENYSYSIKYVDGEYIVKHYKLSDLQNDDFTEVKYIANALIGGYLRFKQIWRETKDGDPLCEGMKVLQPAELVFLGFTNK